MIDLVTRERVCRFVAPVDMNKILLTFKTVKSEFEHYWRKEYGHNFVENAVALDDPDIIAKRIALLRPRIEKGPAQFPQPQGGKEADQLTTMPDVAIDMMGLFVNGVASYCGKAVVNRASARACGQEKGTGKLLPLQGTLIHMEIQLLTEWAYMCKYVDNGLRMCVMFELKQDIVTEMDGISKIEYAYGLKTNYDSSATRYQNK